MSGLVYKLVNAADWQRACADGSYWGSPDDRRDGFIHLSAAHQVAGTAERHFRNQSDLVLVAFDAASLGGNLKWERSRDGDLFPHLYGPLPVQLALWQKAMSLDAGGVPQAELENKDAD